MSRCSTSCRRAAQPVDDQARFERRAASGGVQARSRERVAAGERAYVVCPKVEATTRTTRLRAVEGRDHRRDELARSAAASVRVGLVHGRLDGDARDRVMRAFKRGELDVLVATTVIEVGVDVPAATVMVIHDADRFGLAQLHQLRGRVGRGGGAAHCVLRHPRQRSPRMAGSASARWSGPTDGFRIAETDLALRGPGELCGPRQAGVPRLRYGDLAQHTELLLEARRHASGSSTRIRTWHDPSTRRFERALARRLAQSVYGAESG